MKRVQTEKRGEAMHAIIRFADGTSYDKPAQLDFLGVSVDESTDMVTVRGIVPNPDGVLMDHQLVRVAVEGDEPDQKVLVPQSSLLADQNGPCASILQNGEAAIRRLTIGGEIGPDAIVEAGLSGGEQVIVEGAQLLRPGAAVAPQPATPLPRS
jgi:membrane fusion protein, multidrug efflux system